MAKKITLAQISKRAKTIRRDKPSMKWTDAIKKASRELKGIGSTHHKKKPAAKKRKVTVVNISGTKTHHKKRTTMAKTKKRRSHHRRRRGMGSVVSASGYNKILMTVAGSVAGGVVAGMIESQLSGKVSNPKVMSLIQLGGGAIVARQMGHSPFFMGMGMGIAATGASTLLKQSGFLKGLGDAYDGMNGDGEYYVAGADDEDAHGLAGDDDMMSGDEDYMSGDDDYTV